MSDVAQEIIAIERAALDRWEKGDMSGYFALYGEEVTYFDWGTERRIDGHDALRAQLGPFDGKFTIDRIVMVNPKVQVYGDVAILSYNAIDHGSEMMGTKSPPGAANITSVFARPGERWRMVHAHYSHTKAVAPA
jgi:ketosteroid isomerase-like protein